MNADALARPARRLRDYRPGPWMTLTLTMLTAVVALGLVDAIPGLIHGIPTRVRRYPSVADAERAAGRKLSMPAYFPDSLRYPPSRVLAAVPARTVALEFDGRDERPARLLIVESTDRTASWDPALVPAVIVMESRAIAVDGEPASLRRVLDAESRQYHELEWTTSRRRMLLRFDGPIDQLIVMAQSIGRHLP